MPAFRQILRPGEKTRSILAAAMLAQWVVLLIVSSSERLHHSVCADAKQPSHDCAFVSLAKGHVSSPIDPVAAPAPRESVAWVPVWVRDSFRSAVDLRLMPDRGPPRSLLPL